MIAAADESARSRQIEIWRLEEDMFGRWLSLKVLRIPLAGLKELSSRRCVVSRSGSGRLSARVGAS